MGYTEKLLLIIAYQLSGEMAKFGKRICPSCRMIGDHIDSCELGKVETWVREELTKLWRQRE